MVEEGLYETGESVKHGPLTLWQRPLLWLPARRRQHLPEQFACLARRRDARAPLAVVLRLPGGGEPCNDRAVLTVAPACGSRYGRGSANSRA